MGPTRNRGGRPTARSCAGEFRPITSRQEAFKHDLSSPANHLGTIVALRLGEGYSNTTDMLCSPNVKANAATAETVGCSDMRYAMRDSSARSTEIDDLPLNGSNFTTGIRAQSENPRGTGLASSLHHISSAHNDTPTPIRWMRGILVLLVILCLALAVWVWADILHGIP